MSFRFLFFIPLTFYVVGVFAGQRPSTDLGPVGNRAVAERFNEYLKSAAACVPVGDGPRVMLSGFGLFSGISFNTSGAVIENLSRVIDLPTVPTGILTSADHGARVVNRQMVLRGQNVSVCLILLDVQWDFAAAVLVNEMQRFQPDLMIMTGLGGANATVESGALNEVIRARGFNADGSQNLDNRPVGDKILDDQPAGAVPMTWDQQAMAVAVRPLIEAEGFHLQVPDAARPSNDYICNNVSYVALQAGLNHRLSLAGGELVIEPRIVRAPATGFFHYPMGVRLEKQSIQNWSKVLLAMVEAGLAK